MAADDEMTIAERRKYLKKQRTRYRRANRAEKGRLLSEMETVTGLHRKSLVRLLNQENLSRQPARTRRGRTYGAEVEQVIVVVWESLDYVCADRVQPQLLATAQHLAGFGEVHLTPQIEAQLERISVATVQRLLHRHRRPPRRLPQKGPEAANRLRQAVPMQRIPWDTAEPGHFEVDLVHHAGGSAAGEYGHTLQLIDVATGWSERVALLGRSQAAMATAFRQVLDRLPFPVLELHPDNGSEFFNAHLQRLFDDRLPTLVRSRSRPYRKNDNRFVEQKNATLVRAYLGHHRLDTAEQIAALNALYDQLWVYYNLFQPVLRLKEKRIIDGKTRRVWDPAQTPYQRLLATGMLTIEQQGRLGQWYASTNPRRLRREIDAALIDLWHDCQPDRLAAD
ncbi:MAG TPA: hypothetical protein VND96_13855 [Candidatus Micrarchaeaceae archaeon]|nr:hypothetical protein [Candidatus Micrarchaeaceae archaeon]